jgi:hypothetical protein
LLAGIPSFPAVLWPSLFLDRLSPGSFCTVTWLLPGALDGSSECRVRVNSVERTWSYIELTPKKKRAKEMLLPSFEIVGTCGVAQFLLLHLI